MASGAGLMLSGLDQAPDVHRKLAGPARAAGGSGPEAQAVAP